MAPKNKLVQPSYRGRSDFLDQTFKILDIINQECDAWGVDSGLQPICPSPQISIVPEPKNELSVEKNP